MSDIDPPSSRPSPDAAPLSIRTLDDFLARELPRLTKRERRRLAARGGITINGREVTDVAETVGERDRVVLPPAPGGTAWQDTPAKPAPRAPSPRESARPDTPSRPLHVRPDAPRTRRPAADFTPGPGTPAPRVSSNPTSSRPPVVDWTPAGAQPARQIQFEGRIRQGVPDPRAKRFLARGIRLVYEDDDIIIIDKSPGVLTADPTEKNTDTVFDTIKKYMRRSGRVGGRGSDRRGRVWIIHRLDKEASGLLVFTKTSEAFESIKEQFRSKRTDRVYVAVVEGVIGEPGYAGTHQSFLVDGSEREMRVQSISAADFRGTPGQDARLAVTHYRVVASNADVLAGTGGSLVQVRLDTGRKNQIRAHMADLGHPIVGDQRYGAVTDPFGRVALHAGDLGFTHPRTGRSVRFSSPPPGTFYRAVGSKPPHEDEPEDIQSSADRPAPSRNLPAATRVGQGEVDTSWDRVAGWYDDLISEKQNDHYEEVIMPGTLRLIQPHPGMRFLDVACGQGVLSRRLTTLGVHATGVDASPQLISAARARGSGMGGTGGSGGGGVSPTYHVGDARELHALRLPPESFDGAACVMALGNIEPLDPVIRGIGHALRVGGSLTIVVAHPAFRAAGQTSWGWDETAKKQYRRVDGYLSNGQRAIHMHPGKDASIVTWTFHRPLQAYVKALADAGFGIEMIEEWAGKRVSTSGPRAAEENRIRREIPLFLAVRAIKRPV